MTPGACVRLAARVFRAQLPEGWRCSPIPAEGCDELPRWRGDVGELHYCPAGSGEWLRLALGVNRSAGGMLVFWYVCRDQGFGDSLPSGLWLPDAESVAAMMCRAAASAAEDWATECDEVPPARFGFGLMPGVVS